MAASATSPSRVTGSSPLLHPEKPRQSSIVSVASTQDGDRKSSLGSASSTAGGATTNTNGGSSSLDPTSAADQHDKTPSRSSTVSRKSYTGAAPEAQSAAPPPKKPGLAARLFSHRGESQSAASSSSAATTAKQNGEQTEGKTRALPIRQNSLVAALKLQSNANSDAKTSEAAAGTVEKTKEGAEQAPASRRFVMCDDGGHEHHLKADRREEKLSNLFRSFLGKKKEGHPVQDDYQLSLRSSWVDQMKSEKAVSDQKGGPNSTDTLVEKYGKCQEVVGRGAFGIVRISHKTDSKDPKKEHLYAVKEFRRRPNESPKKYNKRLTAEFCISSALRHPNVIHTLDLMKDAKGDFCEVMEYCAGGDLYTLVLAAGKLETLEADCYFKQLMRGVEYIHEMGVAHRDLKPENLLVTSHGALKITDFGNGECFRMAWEKEAHMVAGLCGSAPYIAPEEYVDQEFDPRPVDVWACGVIYMAMRTGRHLWRVARKDEDEFYERYLRGRKDEDGYGPIESLHRARCRNVVYSILDPNPGRRITASQVLKSEWGREIKLCRAGEEGF